MRSQEARPRGAVAGAGVPRTRRTQDRPDRRASVGSTPERGIELRGSSAVARESSRGYRSGEVGPGIARMLMARSCIRPATGAVHDGPETPEDAAVGQGADANDDRPSGSSARGEMKRPPGRLCSKRSSDEGRQDEQRQQPSKRLVTTELVIHRQPHTGGGQLLDSTACGPTSQTISPQSL
jgi:hypothetical protein